MTIALERKSTVDQAAEALRREILAGELAPGAPLREAWLAERLGIARNTVRETLQLLAHQGLVTHEAHRGATVTLVGEEDVRDIFAVRRMLELEGVRRVERTDLADLERAVERLEGAAEEGDWISFADHEAGFHEGLVRRVGSRRLSVAFRRALRELRVALAGIDVAQGADRSLPGYVREHRTILRRIAAGEGKRATDLLASHLDSSERMVLRHLRETS